MRSKIFPVIIFFAALSVSGSAAFYSIIGLSKLFGGAASEVIVMATSLECSKLIIASALHHYWKILSVWLKSYLIFALVVLVVITSMGIYGFLSNAFEMTSAQDKLETSRIAILENKKAGFAQRKAQYENEYTSIILTINNLRQALTSNTLTSVDKKTGKTVTTTSSANRKSYETQLADAINRRDNISLQIETLTDSVLHLESMILEASTASTITSELGPLKYLSRLTGKKMDVIVNYFLLLLIIVFDPLALALVFTANITFFTKKNNVSRKPELYIKNQDRPRPDQDQTQNNSEPDQDQTQNNSEPDQDQTQKEDRWGDSEANSDMRSGTIGGKIVSTESDLPRTLIDRLTSLIPKRLSPSEVKNAPHQNLKR